MLTKATTPRVLSLSESENMYPRMDFQVHIGLGMYPKMRNRVHVGSDMYPKTRKRVYVGLDMYPRTAFWVHIVQIIRLRFPIARSVRL